jgi:CRISPR-associated protein Csb1
MSLFDELRPNLTNDPSRPRAAGIEFKQTLEPAGGLPVWPPSYEGRYEIHPRHIDGERRDVIELDSVGSSANRIEEVLLELHRAGKYGLPVITTIVTVDGRQHPITTLDAPHRSFDGWIRLSHDGGVPFEESERGQALSLASTHDLDAVLESSTHDLLFGAWDSHRKGPNGQLRIARAFTSSVIGLDPLPQAQFAARVDPLNLGDSADGKKGDKLSERGLSSIPPQKHVPYSDERKPGERLAGHRGGVSITEARYLGFLSFAALRKLHFTAYDSEDVRTLLVALGLYGVFLRAQEGFELRSRTSLLAVGPLDVALVQADGSREPLTLSLADAEALFDEAKERVAIKDRQIVLDAGTELNDLVAKSIDAQKGKE